MKQIIGAFCTLFVLLLYLFTGAGVLEASGGVAAAKEYKAGVIAQIENSNFNPKVINACIQSAAEAGYELEVTNCEYDMYHNIQTAQVALHYQYRLPLFGITQTKTTYGIAR